MARPAGRRATYEDLLEVPEHLVGEIIDGELITSPRPAPAHALAASALNGEILGPFHLGRGGPGGRWILFEPELHLHADVLVPDLAAWGRTRLSTMPSTAFFELAPDWICEIVSPKTEAIDRSSKLAICPLVDHEPAGENARNLCPRERALESARDVPRIHQGSGRALRRG